MNDVDTVAGSKYEDVSGLAFEYIVRRYYGKYNFLWNNSCCCYLSYYSYYS